MENSNYINIDEDLNAEFNSELLKTNQILDNIKELGIETSRFEKFLTKLKQELYTKREQIYNSYDLKTIFTNTFKNDYLQPIYQEAITNLQKLQINLSEEFDLYFQIDININFIKNSIITLNKSNIEEIIKSTKNLLKLMKIPSSIDYQVKEKIIDNAYHLVYEVIKKEILINKNSTILNFVSLNEIDIPYLNKCILEEISNIDLEAEENKLIKMKLFEIRRDGLESNLLNIELLSLLNMKETKNQNQILKQEIIKEFENVNDYITELSNIKEELSKHKQIFTTDKNFTVDNLITFLKPTSALIGYVASFIILTTGTPKFIRTRFAKVYYPTTEITYDVSKKTELPPKTYEANLIKEPLQFIKYNIWEENQARNSNDYRYKRELLIYNISEIKYDSLQEYVNLDFNALGIEPKLTTEYKETLVPTDLYKENFSLIKKYIQNLEAGEKKLIDKKSPLILMLILSLEMIYLSVYITLYIKLCDNDLDFKELIYQMKRLIKSLIDLKISQKNYSQTKKELNKFLIHYKKILNSLEEIYTELPDTLKEEPEIQSILKKVRKPELN